MAEKLLNTKIQLRYDSFENWNAAGIDAKGNGTGANLILKAGELGICYIPGESNEINTNSTILFKVGDGTTIFSLLPWVSALAADVYDWAKNATKPVYNANEIVDLKSFYNFEEGNVNGAFAVSKGTDASQSIKIHGLGSAAYTASTNYDPAGAAATVKTAVLGKATGGADFDGTVKGAYEKFQALMGTSGDSLESNTILGLKAAISVAQSTADSKTTMQAVEAKGYQTAEQVKAIKVNEAFVADRVAHTLTIGSHVFDGSADVRVGEYFGEYDIQNS